MDAAAYDAWYRSPRGRWIGEIEFRLVSALLDARPAESLLDVGCGTGYFTRRLAREAGLAATGLDPDAAWIGFARSHAGPAERYVRGSALALPFGDRSFDLVTAITSLCFIADEVGAVRELARVARRRFVLGLLNRHSLLWVRKGRRGGRGAYAGARWHTVAEVQRLLAGIDARDVRIDTAILLPSGGVVARGLEQLGAGAVPFGAFIAAAAEPGSGARISPKSRQ